MINIDADVRRDSTRDRNRRFDGCRLVTTEVGGKKAMKMWLEPGFNWTKTIRPLLPGCPEWCPATHFGYLEQGTMKVEYENGTSETINAGETYLCTPGHRPEILGDKTTIMVEFSESTAKVIDDMKKD